MRIYDITLPVHPDLPTWPGDPPIVVERFVKKEDGAPNNVTRIAMCAHTGTHVDAQRHFLGGDVETVDQISLKTLTGRVYVLDLPDEKLITAKVLEKAEIPPRTRRLIFKTRNSALWGESAGFPAHTFKEDFVAISPDGAEFLVERGVKLVGVDYLSVATYDDPVPTHEILLKAGIVIIEGLNLSEVSQGRYSLYCLPLKLAGADGAPARAILIGV
jgi:arylformamidase